MNATFVILVTKTNIRRSRAVVFLSGGTTNKLSANRTLKHTMTRFPKRFTKELQGGKLKKKPGRIKRNLVHLVVEKAGKIFTQLLLKIMFCTNVLFVQDRSICSLVFSQRKNFLELFLIFKKKWKFRYYTFLCCEWILFDFFMGIIIVRFFLTYKKPPKKADNYYAFSGIFISIKFGIWL